MENNVETKVVKGGLFKKVVKGVILGAAAVGLAVVGVCKFTGKAIFGEKEKPCDNEACENTEVTE